MVIRSIFAAALFASAATASAGPVPASSSVLGAWTLNAGSVNVVGAVDSIDAIIAAGNWAAFTSAWNMHTSLGDQNSSAVLFAPSAKGALTQAFVTGGAKGGGSAAVAGGAAGGSAGGSFGGGASASAAGGNAGAGGSVGVGAGGSAVIEVGALPPAGAFDAPVIGADIGGGAADAIEVPEPGSLSLLLAGLAGATLFTRRRKH